MLEMNLLIATPAYGGLVTTDYLLSLLDTMHMLEKRGIYCYVHTLRNESLIPRGRNACAWYALAKGPGGESFDKLLFIDADMKWNVSDVEKLLESDKRVVGGTYPIKTYPIELAANSLDEHKGLFDASERSVAQLIALREAHGNSRGEIPMKHIPTGFMLIDVSILAQLTQLVPTYVGTDWSTRAAVRMWDFFPIGPLSGKPDAVYESEDWAFCSLVRKHFPKEGVWLNSHVVTKHIGTHTFSAGNL